MNDLEQRLVDSVMLGSSEFRDVVEQLVGQLLSEVGYTARPTDGVLFEWLEVGDGRAFAFGLAVMIDTQRVEPLRVEVQLDAGRRRIASGLVQFGSSQHRAAAYGSAEHHRMTRRILADREHQFAWVEQFRADVDGWRRLPPATPHGT